MITIPSIARTSCFKCGQKGHTKNVCKVKDSRKSKKKFKKLHSVADDGSSSEDQNSFSEETNPNPVGWNGIFGYLTSHEAYCLCVGNHSGHNLHTRG